MNRKKNTRAVAALLCGALLALVLLSGCSASAEPVKAQGKSYFTYFDTVTYIYSYAGDSAERFSDCSAEIADMLGEYHQLFDIYHEYSGINNLCTVNKMAGGEAVAVDARLMEFLLYAKELYELTGGEMNVMMGSVLTLWHNAREAASEDPKNAYVPAEEDLAEAAKHTDISLLELDEENNTVRISDPLASIDVGALGKGYATEMAAQKAETLGCESYVLNVGGNIRIIGTRPDGTGWKTGVRDPKNPDSNYCAKLLLADTSCVTSGIYERYFTVDGVRYHHIIDKDTLYPSTLFTSVTVVTKNSGLADALSTALFCMPLADGEALCEKLGDVEALWVLPDGELYMTSGMEAILVPDDTSGKSQS